jgi:MFS family permease
MLSLYVLKNTGSATAFASVLSIAVIPNIVMIPMAGVIGDRYNKRKILSTISILYTIVFISFGTILYYGKSFNLIVIYLLVVILEILEVFYNGPQDAIIPQIVDEEHMAEANSVSQIDNNVVSLIGPLIAAFLYESFDILGGMVIGSVLTLISSVLTCRIIIEREEAKLSTSNKNSIFKDFKEGMYLIKDNSLIRKITILPPMCNMFLGPILTIVMTYFLVSVVNLEATKYGLYKSLISAVALLGPVAAFNIIKKNDEKKIVPIFIGGISFLLLILTGVIYLSYSGFIGIEPMYIMTIIIVGSIFIVVTIYNIANNVVRQKCVPIEYLSRVSSFTQALSSIIMPVSLMIFGILLDNFPVYISTTVGVIGMLLIFIRAKSMFKNE